MGTKHLPEKCPFVTLKEHSRFGNFCRYSFKDHNKIYKIITICESLAMILQLKYRGFLRREYVGKPGEGHFRDAIVFISPTSQKQRQRH